MNKKQEILEAFNARHACKEFDLDKKISKEDFEFILETGRLSPSSFGWEPWKFVIVQNMETREKIKEYAWGAQTQLPTASHFVLLLARKSVDMKVGSDYLNDIQKEVEHLPEEIIKMKSAAYQNFLENDFNITDDRSMFDWTCKQAYIPLANMMSAAAQIGIDSCPMEGFNREKMDAFLDSEKIVDSTHYGLAVMVAFGYRKGDAPFEKTRQSKEEVVSWVL